LPWIREVRPVEPAGTWQVIVQLVALQPIRGLRMSVFADQSTSEVQNREHEVPVAVPDRRAKRASR
jgi:hypothetical protein